MVFSNILPTTNLECNQTILISSDNQQFPLLIIGCNLSYSDKINIDDTISLTKVSQFELSLVVNEEVLWLEVSVQNLSLVTVGQTSQQLEHKDLQREAVV